VLTVAPDRRRRLAQGALVEASIVARVLGLRLLTLKATIVLAPADMTTPSAVRAGERRSLSRVPGRRVGGRGLADAVRNLDEGAKQLQKARDSRDSRADASRGE
jgi:hypothetical protein